jgi:hypothetical protein
MLEISIRAFVDTMTPDLENKEAAIQEAMKYFDVSRWTVTNASANPKLRREDNRANSGRRVHAGYKRTTGALAHRRAKRTESNET